MAIRNIAIIGEQYINKIIQGDAIEILKQMPSEFVDVIVTSPPYFQLRDYGMPEQIGLEDTLKQYVDKLLIITKELKRILKPTGILFWNHGDSYGGSNRGINDYREIDGLGQKPRTQYTGQKRCTDNTILPKCMAMQNYRLAIRMIDEQRWILRNIIIWNKPNAMPSSVKDRFNNVYEPIFMFVKNRNYWSDLDNVRIPHKGFDKEIKRKILDNKKENHSRRDLGKRTRDTYYHPLGRNPGDVWEIPTQPFRDAHFAVFPEKLVEIMLKFACPRWICRKCGYIRKRIVEKEYVPTRPGLNTGKGKSGKDGDPNKSLQASPLSKYRMKIGYKTIGWTDCGCNAGWRPGIVLDPFMGSGTTAVVAKKLGCDFIGIELNPEYIEMAEKRLAQLKLF